MRRILSRTTPVIAPRAFGCVDAAARTPLAIAARLCAAGPQPVQLRRGSKNCSAQPARVPGQQPLTETVNEPATSPSPPPYDHPDGGRVRVSPNAYANIRRVNALEGYNNGARFLRLAIESGGCQGFVYKFSFDSEFNETEDIAFPQLDTRLAPNAGGQSPVPRPKAESDDNPFAVVDRCTLTKLQGAIIDYHVELKGSAFVVVGNELVDHSCACAMSFAIKKKQR